MFSVKNHPSSGVRSGYAETLTGTAGAGPQKLSGEGNFPAALTVCVCALQRGMVQRGMVQRHLNPPPNRYGSLQCACAALLLPASARAERLRSVEDALSWTQQLSPLLSACSRCAGSRRLIPWQLLNQRHNYGHSMILFGVLCHLSQHCVSQHCAGWSWMWVFFVHQQLSSRSCCKYTIAIHGKQEIIIHCLK